MRFAIYIASAVIGVPLELMVIGAMLRGGYRRFPLVFVYCILNFLATVVEIAPTIALYTGTSRADASSVAYWWNDEAAFQALNYLVVMSLIYQATARLRSRRMLRASLVAGVVLVAGLTFLIHYNPALTAGDWMTPWTRDLNLCSAILDLALCALLIAQKDKDECVLLLSGGMGVQFAGEAIGGSIRQFALKDRSRGLSLFGSVIMMLSNLVLLFVWWRAFKPSRQHVPGKVRPAPIPAARQEPDPLP